MRSARFECFKCPDLPMMLNAVLIAYFPRRFGDWEGFGDLHGNEWAAGEHKK